MSFSGLLLIIWVCLTAFAIRTPKVRGPNKVTHQAKSFERADFLDPLTSKYKDLRRQARARRWGPKTRRKMRTRWTRKVKQVSRALREEVRQIGSPRPRRDHAWRRTVTERVMSREQGWDAMDWEGIETDGK